MSTEYPNWQHTPTGRPVAILRDGTVLAVVSDDNAAFSWLLRNTNQSVSHALKHEGYSVRPATEEEAANA